MEYWDNFIITSTDDYYSLPELGPSVSKVNLHTAVWTLLEIYLESTESDESAEIFEEAINMVALIEPDDLYNLLINDIAEFNTSESALRSYAEKIVCFNKEEVYAR